MIRVAWSAPLTSRDEKEHMGRSGLVQRLAAALLLVCVVGALTGCAFIEEFVAVPKTATNGAAEDARRDPLGLVLGECFNDPGEPYTWVEPAPCDDAHDFEVYFAFDIEGDEFPGQDFVDQNADSRCGEAFEEFVGVAPEESSISYDFYRPGAGAWIADDRRTVICYAFRDGMDTAGTLRDADPRALRLGDCFAYALDPNDPDAESTIVMSVNRIHCAEPHDYEVYFDFEIASDEAFDSSAVEESAWEGCAEPFSKFIGVDHRDSAYGFGYLYPTKGSWKEGDRVVTCYAYGDGLTTGTLEKIEAPRVDL
jgi:hypothetical protein